MKRNKHLYLTLLIICYLGSSAKAQSTPAGITFFKGNWSGLLHAAATQHKLIFVGTAIKEKNMDQATQTMDYINKIRPSLSG